MTRKLEDICRDLADELEIALKYRLLYEADPEEFELIREAREAIQSINPSQLADTGVKVFYWRVNSAKDAVMAASIIESTDSCEVVSISSPDRDRHIVWAKIPKNDFMWETLRGIEGKIASLHPDPRHLTLGK